MGLTEDLERGPVDDHVLAGELAEAAGRLLLGVRDETGFADARVLKDTGDLRAHEFLMGALAERRPADAVLSEEGRASVAGKSSGVAAMDGPPTGNTDASVRLTADRVWIIDPLDGTREFSEEGRSDWAVHVALWEKGRLAAGAVALPAQGLTLRTSPGGALAVDTSGAARELRQAAPEPGRLRIAVSRSRPPAFVQRLAERLDEAAGLKTELVPIGSAGAKISAVLLGEVDAYVHAGGQYEWDSAAPVAVALAAGAHASRIDGSEAVYNRKDPRLPDILVCHPESAAALLTGIRDVSDSLPE
ncbi:3'(2'),5'-bisphosphate nucleotidase CysQ [Actinomadura sp. 9N407]|uniref:3'(2'),5'-bisphosphate nucleotidase CysQ n=1 Tax=Actinomadura sp. 9N407 TaxID=3375154 RepID=UPI0037B288EF